MIICTCGAKFEGESMFGDALAHWHAERDKELERKLARARREVKMELIQRVGAARYRTWRMNSNRNARERYHAKRQAAMQGAA